MARSASSLMTAGLLLLGLVLMVTPLALWVAWTDAIFLIVLATGAMDGVLYCVLVRFERSADPAQSETTGDFPVDNLPGTIIEDLQRLHPFIHHHRPNGGPKFRTVMNRLKKHLYSRPE
jgi:hypothetical protein